MFVTPQWESDSIGDKRSKELYDAGKTSKKKRKVANTTGVRINSKKLNKFKSNRNNRAVAKPSGNTKQSVAKKSLKHGVVLHEEINRKPEQLVCIEAVIEGSHRDKVEKKKRRRQEKKRKKILKLQSADGNETEFDSKTVALNKSVVVKNSTKHFNRNDENKRSIILKNKTKRKQKPTSRKSINKKVCAVTENSRQQDLPSGNDTDVQKHSQRKIVSDVRDDIIYKCNSKVQKLKEKFLMMQKENANTAVKNSTPKVLSLRQRMLEKLKASRFRYLNEQIYINTGKDAQKYFKNDPDSFKAYHEGYRQQLARWPLNPLDVIIESIKKLPRNYVIADFGCGDAKLAQSVIHQVHSFDLISSNKHVVACDMAHVPLESDSIDVALFCLSLMGTNLKDYMCEANRVLKVGGVLKVVEVESRFETVETFIEGVQQFGFTKVWKDLSHKLFYFLDFRKVKNCKHKSKLPSISLHPCLYKKR